MFFTRLRRHAKWMFVFLALVFAGGFVIFGIGSDQGTGIGDLFRGSGSGDGPPSVSEARERVAENPRNAEAKLELATALETEGDTSEAIVVLGEYVALRPKNEEALRQLASLYLTRGQDFERRAQEAQALAQYRSAGATFGPALQLGEGQPLVQDPIHDAVTAEANAAINAAVSRAREAYQNATQTYERVVAIAPNDPNTQLELAQTAERAGDTNKAIAAYEQFVKLAPDDPNTPLVKDRIKQLQASSSGSSG